MTDLFESQNDLLEWLTGPGIRVVLILGFGIGASLLIRRTLQAMVRPSMLAAPGTVSEAEEERLIRREHTVEGFLTRTFRSLLWFVVLMLALAEFGVQMGPLIAGAGVIGLAVGFGAQTLVKDAIAGVFLLVEDHYDLGDRVRLNNIEGRVVGVSIRRTTIRGDGGETHTIPNGAISYTTNLSRSIRVEEEAATPAERPA